MGEIILGSSKNFDITINATGALQRIFRQVNLHGTQSLSTTVLDLANFNINGYVDYFLENTGNMNAVYDQETITASFSPDPATGLRLDETYITETINALNEIKNWSKGFIKTINIIRDGNKIIDTTTSKKRSNQKRRKKRS